MALATELVEIPFKGGLDLKSDSKLVLPGKLLVLENGVFSKRGIIRKRFGFTELSRTVEGDTDLAAGERLGLFDNELLLFNKRTVYGRSESTDRWIDKGRAVPCVVSNREIIRNSAQQTSVDADSANGITVFAWKDGRDGVRCSVIDDDSGAVLLADTSVNATGGAPLVIAIGGNIHIVYPADSNTDVRIRTIDTGDPLTLIAETVLATTLKAANPLIDVALHGVKAVLAWNLTSGGTQIAYLRMDGTLGAAIDGVADPAEVVLSSKTFAPGDVDTGTERITITAHGFTDNTVVWFTTTDTLPTGLSVSTNYFVTVVDVDTITVSATLGGGDVNLTGAGVGTHTATPQGEASDNCIALAVEQITGEIYLGLHNAVTGLRAVVLNSDFTLKAGPLTLETVTSPVSVNMTGRVVSAGSQIRWFWEVTAAASVNHFLKSCTLTSSGTVAGVAVFKRGLGLAGKAFLHNSIVHVVAVHDSTLQATFFALDSSGNVVARMLPLVAGGLRADETIGKIRSGGTGIFRLPLIKKTRFITDAGTAFTLTGVSDAALDFATTSRYESAQLGRNLHMGGGYLSMYDGHGVVEHGFFLWPEAPTTTPAASGGSMADGTYNYKVLYEWTDNSGQIHRSAVSVAVEAIVSGGGGSGKVTVTIPTLRITAKTSPRSEVSLVVYRTQAGGSLYQRVTSITSPTYNAPGSDTVAYVDTMADSTLASQEILYTTGGILENLAPPASSLIARGKKRIFVVSEEDPHTIWFSKERVIGEGIAFAEGLKIGVDPKGGAITALAVMDDKLIFFKKRSLFASSGAGPDETGGGTQFSEPDEISVDVGCDDPATVASSDDGLLFKSKKGRYRLTRALQVEYVGADVEAHNGLTDTSAVLLADVNQIRFTTSSGPTLVYDYEFGQWGTFTGQAAVDAVLWGSDYVYLSSDGKVWKEASGTYRDGNKRYSLVIETAWNKLAGLQGFQRVRRALLVGTANGDHILSVELGFNYEPGYPEVFTFDSREIANRAYFGSSSYFGADSVFGGVEDSLYQWEMHPVLQKCQSLKLRIKDLPVNADDVGYEMAGLALLAGFKKGVAKLREDKRA